MTPLTPEQEERVREIIAEERGDLPTVDQLLAAMGLRTEGRQPSEVPSGGPHAQSR